MFSHLSQIRLKPIRAPQSNRSQNTSPSPFVPSSRDLPSRVLTILSRSALSNRCQTPTGQVSRADCKGRPRSPSRLIKSPVKVLKLKSSNKKSKLKAGYLHNLGQIYIEQLVSVPVSERKKEESQKAFPRACRADKIELYHMQNKPKGTMTDSLEAESFLYFYSTQPTERVYSPVPHKF